MGDSGDESMSDASSDDVQPIDYKIPTPPMLPPWTYHKGKLRPIDWPEDTKHYYARRNFSGTGFDVLPEDFIVPGVPDLWPYRMGPPTSTVNCNDLIDVYGLQVLNAAGFISYHQTDADTFMYPQARWTEAAIDDLDEPFIHPAFDKDEAFREISEEDYKLLKLPLVLASALLEDETTMTFFYALSNPSCWDQFEDPVHGICTIVRPPDTLSVDEQVATYHKICAMNKYTSWGIGETAASDTVYGRCVEEVNPMDEKTYDASGIGTAVTNIDLNASFLQVLRSYDHHVSNENTHFRDYFVQEMNAAGIPENRRFHTDLRSANLRTNFLLATTIVHELAHAFRGAYFTNFIDVEPWISYHRSNENGYSLEQHIFGCVMQPLHVHTHASDTKAYFQSLVSVPYGFDTTHPWDFDRVNSDETFELMRTVKSDGQPQTGVCHPIPQKYVEKLFDKEMWTQQVPRFGLNALKPPKHPLWSTTV
ncbi:hypothetical protein D6C79_03582 [Aureobasidium pullulans]|nr:hypothetical protein D6C79_03582 [Aureobasidium pullulans]